MPHPSDLGEQRAAEQIIRAAVEKQVEDELEPRRLSLPGGAVADVDGVNSTETVLVEVFARQGALKGGQRGKIARDALKLATLAKSRPSARLIIALADDEAAKSLSAKSWLAEALATWSIEILVVDLDAAVRDGIRQAQTRQVMLNTGPGA